jgi:hypothetical protein
MQQPNPLLTPDEVAKLWKIDPSSVRRIFTNEPGVINVSCGKKHKTIRIPLEVYERVFRKREIAGACCRAADHGNAQRRIAN